MNVAGTKKSSGAPSGFSQYTCDYWVYGYLAELTDLNSILYLTGLCMDI